MYHIVFKSPRHEPRPQYQTVRQKLDSVHNQFELDTIRGSIKSRWALEPFGTLLIQRRVWDIFKKSDDKQIPYYQIPPEIPMNGHIITVEKTADVIWFRMNHEHVAKNGCKMTHIYRDLDESVISDMHLKMTTTSHESTEIAKAMSNISYSVSQFQSLLGNNFVAGYDNMYEKVHNIRDTFATMHGTLTHEREKRRDQAKAIWAECEKYLSQHSTEIN